MGRTAGMTARSISAAVIALCLALPAGSEENAHETLAKDILAELISANTAPSGGNDMRQAVSGLVTRLRNAGFTDEDMTVVAETSTLPNLVIRYRGNSRGTRPLLMMAHLDVVEALPADWTVDPFFLTEKDGYFYGRGTTDNKAGAAIMVANFIRMKREGYVPNRDLIIMLTADEETTGAG